jgi:SAM-dependent methyltransferase
MNPPSTVQTEVAHPLPGSSVRETAYSLETLTGAVNYNRWIYSLMRPYLGQRLLELGAGIGNLTPYFLQDQREVVAIDIDPLLVEEHQRLIPSSPRLSVRCIDLREMARDESLHGSFDSVISSNVLEHIPDKTDSEVVMAMHQLLRVGGTSVHWVPAFQSIYGSLDEAFGHHRRYNRKTARDLFTSAGFNVLRCEYWNIPGFFGWWFKGKIFRHRTLEHPTTYWYDRHIVPLLRRVEPMLPRPFGQSLLIVGVKI